MGIMAIAENDNGIGVPLAPFDAPSRRPLMPRIEQSLLAMGPIRATAALTVASVAVAELIHLIILMVAHPLFERATLRSSVAVTLVVATPIVYYSQLLIRRLVQSRRDLRALTEKFAVALDEAQAANETKLRFFANANHELRTPLNAILGFSEIIETEAFGPVSQPRYREYAGDIHRSADHLLSLVNDLLDLTRTETRGRPLQDEGYCDLRQVMEEALHMIWPVAEREGVTLQSRVATQIDGLRANERMVKQILLNLLSNAVKFAPGGEVLLSAWRDDGGAIEIAATDNGIGMSPAEVAIALTPFGQVDNKLTRKHAGTGLGLPLARAMMEMHGGSLRIESEIGRGTIVTLRFPAARVEARPEAAMAVEAALR
jgi:two-component system cell cycle sensor histidine kinase PleC